MNFNFAYFFFIFFFFVNETSEYVQLLFGGICFRPFIERNLAEVVFLAIHPDYQIKGFGTRLMNHLKQNLKLYKITTIQKIKM